MSKSDYWDVVAECTLHWTESQWHTNTHTYRVAWDIYNGYGIVDGRGYDFGPDFPEWNNRISVFRGESSPPLKKRFSSIGMAYKYIISKRDVLEM